MGSADEFIGFFACLDRLKFLWPKLVVDGFNVSTATILSRSDQRVDLKNIAKLEEDEELASLRCVYSVHDSCPDGTLAIRWSKQRQKKVGEFGNQVTLAFSSLSKRSIKIFSHGGIHITGCKNTSEFDHIVGVVEKLLLACGAITSQWRLERPKTVMLNFNFDLHCTLSLRRLSMVVLQRFNIHCTHETETHPALMMRFPCHDDPEQPSTLVMVFTSGKVLVSSPQGIQGVMFAYRLVCQMVNDDFDFLKGASCSTAKANKKRKLDVHIEGYPAGQALPCMQFSK